MLSSMADISPRVVTKTLEVWPTGLHNHTCNFSCLVPDRSCSVCAPCHNSTSAAVVRHPDKGGKKGLIWLPVLAPHCGEVRPGTCTRTVVKSRDMNSGMLLAFLLVFISNSPLSPCLGSGATHSRLALPI